MKLLLFLHVLGAVLFLGNIITAAFWKIRADRQGDPAIIHQTARNVMLADWVFTLPGLLLLIVSGNGMAHLAGYPLSGFNWLTLSLLLFGLTGILWLAVLIPLQRSLIRHSGQTVETGVIPEAYRRASAYWTGFGIAATLLPVAILYLMIVKDV